MKERVNKEKLPIPKLMELIFDSCYLMIVVTLGLYCIVTADHITKQLWGIMALTLAFGDACHLVPRMAVSLTPNPKKFTVSLGFGKMLTSITMTIFYVLLWNCGLLIFNQMFVIPTVFLYLFAAVRIILCLLPQNKWTQTPASYTWGIYRNIPFVLQGCLVLWLFGNYASDYLTMRWMAVSIFLSFAFYIPVVLFAHKYPKLGMLMLPKSCVYIWMICMGLSL